MKILGVLQNAWFKPGTPPGFIRRYHSDQRFMRAVLSRSHSGKRLRAVLGEDLFRAIRWTEASPAHGNHSGHLSKPDPAWLACAIADFQPELIATFGALARSTVTLVAPTCAVIYCTHPAYRLQKSFIASVEPLKVMWLQGEREQCLNPNQNPK